MFPLPAALKTMIVSQCISDHPLDGRDAWAICNHITTVAVSRLVPPQGRVIPRMDEKDFQKIVQKVMANLPEHA